jgi:hypothetical protein
MLLHKMDIINPKTFVKMFDDMGVLNDPASVTVLYCVGACDERGRLGFEKNSFAHLNALTIAHNAYRSVKFADVFPNGEKNANKIQDGLRRARTAAVAKARNET